MIKYLIFVSMAFVMLLASCNNDTTNPADSNNIIAGFNCDVSGVKNFKYSVSTATAVLTEIDGKTALSIMASSTNPEAPYQFIITVFGNTKGTYEQTVDNPSDPQAMCSIIADSSQPYISTSGKVTITEIGTTLGSKVKGTFNFHLYDATLGKEITVTNGTFNVPFVVL